MVFGEKDNEMFPKWAFSYFILKMLPRKFYGIGRANGAVCRLNQRVVPVGLLICSFWSRNVMVGEQ